MSLGKAFRGGFWWGSKQKGMMFLYLESWTDAEQSHRPRICDHLDKRLVTTWDIYDIPALQTDKTSGGGFCLCL